MKKRRELRTAAKRRRKVVKAPSPRGHRVARRRVKASKSRWRP